ncbi:MAG: ISKra4 family transposase, partial [Dermatophilaceae bacterium]
ATGTTIGKRQVEDLTRAAALDVEAFYAAHRPAPASAQDILVLSADGKGVVMRPDAVRAATARSARSRKLSTRLSKGREA